MKNKEADLEASIFWLEKSIEQNELSNHEKDKLIDELNTKKKELEQFVQYKTKGSIIRSKARWYNEGKQNSKYFLNLEIRHYKNNTISQLKMDNNETLTSDKDILGFILACMRQTRQEKTNQSMNNFFHQRNRVN